MYGILHFILPLLWNSFYLSRTKDSMDRKECSSGKTLQQISRTFGIYGAQFHCQHAFISQLSHYWMADEIKTIILFKLTAVIRSSVLDFSPYYVSQMKHVCIRRNIKYSTLHIATEVQMSQVSKAQIQNAFIWTG